MKFGRRYKVTIEMQGSSEAIVIEMPITMQFNIHRDNAFGINTMDLQFFNLSDKNRNQIFKDRFTPFQYHRIIVQAGYDELSTIFIGNIWEANSRREGTNVITSINARDGGFDSYTAKVFVTLNKGKTVQDLISYLTAQFPNLQPGKIGGLGADIILPRPVTIEGNLYGAIRGYTNNNVFIDLEKINILQNNEVFTATLPLITADTGLLETPRRDNSYMQVTMLFEPRITIGQLVALQSKVLPQYNGDYKVVGVSHQGIISEAQNGRCVSIFSLYNPSQQYAKLVTV